MNTILINKQIKTNAKIMTSHALNFTNIIYTCRLTNISDWSASYVLSTKRYERKKGKIKREREKRKNMFVADNNWYRFINTKTYIEYNRKSSIFPSSIK